MNIPSMKPSSPRTFCCSDSWFRKACHKSSNTPLSAHSLNRRWTALLEPYRWGSSLQDALVHRIRRMPSKQRRSSKGGRSPFRLRRRLRRCCLICSHCLSLTAHHAIGFFLRLRRLFTPSYLLTRLGVTSSSLLFRSPLDLDPATTAAGESSGTQSLSWHLLFLLEPMAGEFQRPAVLRHHPHHVVRYPIGHRGLDLQGYGDLGTQ